MAEAIYTGTLPDEPFYHAPGYALMLAVRRGLGASQTGLFPAALALGVVLHACNALLIASIARGLFGFSILYLFGLFAALLAEAAAALVGG